MPDGRGQLYPAVRVNYGPHYTGRRRISACRFARIRARLAPSHYFDSKRLRRRSDILSEFRHSDQPGDLLLAAWLCLQFGQPIEKEIQLMLIGDPAAVNESAD